MRLKLKLLMLKYSQRCCQLQSFVIIFFHNYFIKATSQIKQLYQLFILQYKVYLFQLIQKLKPSMMDQQFPQDIQCIVQPQQMKGGIYISNIQVACNPATLKQHGIGAVLTAIKGKNLADIVPKHMEYMYIPAVDHEKFDISFNFIDQQRKRTNILVHCMAGVSRSVTLVIAYLMKKSKLPMQKAYQYVKLKRNKIFPNQSFIKQLKNYETIIQIQQYNPKQLRSSNKSNANTLSTASLNNSFCKNQSSIKTSATSFASYASSYDENLKENIKKLFMDKKKNGQPANTKWGSKSINRMIR